MLKNEIIPQSETELRDSPLGKNSSYISQYTPSLLFAIPRKAKREDIGIFEQLPFIGFDTWNAYEVSWLNAKGKPIVAIAQFDIPCTSTNIIESKSFKLYLNSFNNTTFNLAEDVQKTMQQDISKAVDGNVSVNLFKLEGLSGQRIKQFSGECLDDQDIECDSYLINPAYLSSKPKEVIEQSLYSNLLKSNCLVTGQPDWGSVLIQYKGPKIDKAGLLKYIVSFRDHNEFHEQCVERIFMDILTHCKPERLAVEARYTRRGGLDINPIRSSEHVVPSENIRMARQ